MLRLIPLGGPTKFYAGVRTAVAEENDKYEDDLEKLIDTGKEKGYLTYGEVNDLLPGEITSPDELDDLMTTINTQGIDVLAGDTRTERATSMSPKPAKSPTMSNSTSRRARWRRPTTLYACTCARWAPSRC